jgi:branched-chain amino acid transport system permease protein
MSASSTDPTETAQLPPVPPAPEGATDETTTIAPVDGEVAAPARHDEDFTPSTAGRVARWAVWALLVWLVVCLPTNALSPFTLNQTSIGHLSDALVFAIIGLSLNVLLGYAGTISLGHQAFVGVGAFTAAYLVTTMELDFFFALGVAAVLGGLQAALLGAVSLRLTGLYFALVTLAYGFFTEQTIFGIEKLTGGEAGTQMSRPPAFESGEAYYVLVLLVLSAVVFVDWRLTRSKAGRALAALRENPRVASSYGIDVRAYTLIAFTVSGVFAGVGGALFAGRQQFLVQNTFGFELALTFVLMTVVGGLRNRVGVIIGSIFFALLGSGELVHAIPGAEGFLAGTLGLPVEFVPLVIGPILLLLTITLFPGGIGQQVAPLQGWIAGRRFDPHAGKVEEVEVNDVRA